ncbi:hypothetical protein GGF41_006291 [Coemansia sp. RSA 2531]|nr:hypothetical protein GGF41_006291 [Coemansia sp. RSA 2531]
MNKTDSVAALYAKCREVYNINDPLTVVIKFGDQEVAQSEAANLETYFTGLYKVLVNVEISLPLDVSLTTIHIKQVAPAA